MNPPLFVWPRIEVDDRFRQPSGALFCSWFSNRWLRSQTRLPPATIFSPLRGYLFCCLFKREIALAGSLTARYLSPLRGCRLNAAKRLHFGLPAGAIVAVR